MRYAPAPGAATTKAPMIIPPVIFMRGSAIFPVSKPQMTRNTMKRITHNPTV